MPDHIKIKITGLGAAQKKLAAVGVRLRSSIVRDALDEVTEPILTDMRNLVAVDTGNLRRSLGKRLKSYRSGTVHVAVLGPRRGALFTNKAGQRASRYAHFVEFGVPANGIPAQPFIRPAWDNHKSGFAARLTAAIFTRVQII